MNINIENFFKEYATNFSKQNADGIFNMCSFPLCFYLPNGTGIIANESQFSENSKLLLELYDNLGMTSASPQIVSITNINAHTHLVEIQWRLLEEEKELVSFSTQYILGESNQQFKILGIFEIDEQEKINQLEASKKAAHK